jgi:hypothetical protein
LEGVEEVREVLGGWEHGAEFGIFFRVVEGEEEGEPLFGGEEGLGKFGAELDLLDVTAAGVGAVLGVAGDEEFAAGEGAMGVDGAGAVFEEGAGELLGEVGAIELGEVVGRKYVAILEFFEEACAVEGGEIFGEAFADARGVGGGKLREEMSEGVGFGWSDGDHLAAAGVAAFGASDGSFAFERALLGDVHDGVGEFLEDGEEEPPGGLCAWSDPPAWGGKINGSFNFGTVHGELYMEAF